MRRSQRARGEGALSDVRLPPWTRPLAMGWTAALEPCSAIRDDTISATYDVAARPT